VVRVCNGCVLLSGYFCECEGQVGCGHKQYLS